MNLDKNKREIGSLNSRIWGGAFFGILLFIPFFVGCKQGYTSKLLIDDVSTLNSCCPINAGKMGTIEKAEIEDSCIVMHYLLTEEMQKMAWSDFKAVFDERLQYVDLLMADTTNLQNDPLAKLHLDAFNEGYRIINKYHTKLHDNYATMVETTSLDPREFYEKYSNKDMRHICEEALEIRKNNENRLYKSLNLPDSLASFDAIEDSLFVIGSYVPTKDYITVWFDQIGLRKNLLKAFKDPSMISFAKQCITCEKGIGFRYISLQKKDSICINFSPKELENLVYHYDEVINMYEKIEQLK